MGFFHFIGVFLLFAASILLLITTISAPVVNDIALLRVHLNNGSTLNFGTFGYCVLNAAQPNDGNDWCSKVHIGYKPANIIASTAASQDFDEITGGTSDALTSTMVLHPIECGLAFIAFVISAFAGMFGSLFGALIALVAWILTLISLAIDFTVFGIVHHHVSDYSAGRERATFGDGIWCLAAAFVALFFGMFIVFFTCCAARREKRRGVASKQEVQPVQTRRKRFGMF
ncbi:actin cortical patch SUR7/pH-response regulator pali [Neohortaea acidophila]|uniref:Actin cortical patch SUR7/pH-response regulator pali n=1 Tax=Neohortaea acidophila TaxID=245834 RepID=A0A6A6PKX8_9PEZI|nr:actin cortical patch SUR7/pH-response regulator pali [Neohortaea acidophila]KAF2480314.1 actin cortical patch SUR7/pH-response regulator pali [Neohortaea acidophila]